MGEEGSVIKLRLSCVAREPTEQEKVAHERESVTKIEEENPLGGERSTSRAFIKSLTKRRRDLYMAKDVDQFGKEESRRRRRSRGRRRKGIVGMEREEGKFVENK